MDIYTPLAIVTETDGPGKLALLQTSPEILSNSSPFVASHNSSSLFIIYLFYTICGVKSMIIKIYCIAFNSDGTDPRKKDFEVLFYDLKIEYY